MSFVRIDGLRKYYGSLTAVSIDHLEVNEGEFLSLLGPSGCGKTTTLRCVAGIVEPDEGVISIRGKDITRVPPYRRNLGMVFQSYALFPHFSVFDNIAYGLKNRGMKGDILKKKVTDVLELVELPQIADRYPHQLSGGQQQRVALARAVVYDPDVLLLDEPFSNLDAKLRKSMRFEVKKLQRRLNLTTIFVTHDQHEALSLSDTIVVMDSGKVEQVGAPTDVYENPQTLFVADFIGATNVLKGVARSFDSKTSRCQVLLKDGKELIACTDCEVSPQSEVDMIIKAEKIKIVPSDVAGSNIVSGEVVSAGYSGSAYNYQVELADGSLIEVSCDVHDEAGNWIEFAIGAKISVQLESNHLKVVRKEKK